MQMFFDRVMRYRTPSPPWTDTAPVREERSASNGSSNTRRVLPPRRARRKRRSPCCRCIRGSTTMPRCCSRRFARAPPSWKEATGWSPPPNGCSTTITSSKNRFAKSATTCRSAITSCCPSSRWGRSPAIRGYSVLPGPSSPIPTATSIRRSCGVSSPRINVSQPLTIGELWAVAITLRIVLIENLRRLADQITVGRGARADADALTERLFESGSARSALEADISTRSSGLLSELFAAQLAKRLRDRDPRTMPRAGLARGTAQGTGQLGRGSRAACPAAARGRRTSRSAT